MSHQIDKPMSAEVSEALAKLPSGETRPKLTERPRERCTNCQDGVQRSDQGFAFRCGSCGGEGWVYDDAALTVRSVRAEMEQESRDDYDR